MNNFLHRRDHPPHNYSHCFLGFFSLSETDAVFLQSTLQDINVHSQWEPCKTHSNKWDWWLIYDHLHVIIWQDFLFWVNGSLIPTGVYSKVVWLLIFTHREKKKEKILLSSFLSFLSWFQTWLVTVVWLTNLQSGQLFVYEGVWDNLTKWMSFISTWEGLMFMFSLVERPQFDN